MAPPDIGEEPGRRGGGGRKAGRSPRSVSGLPASVLRGEVSLHLNPSVATALEVAETLPANFRGRRGYGASRRGSRGRCGNESRSRGTETSYRGAPQPTRAPFEEEAHVPAPVFRPVRAGCMDRRLRGPAGPGRGAPRRHLQRRQLRHVHPRRPAGSDHGRSGDGGRGHDPDRRSTGVHRAPDVDRRSSGHARRHALVHQLDAPEPLL